MKHYILGRIFNTKLAWVLEALFNNMKVTYVTKSNYGQIKMFPTRLLARILRKEVQTIRRHYYPLEIYSLEEVVSKLDRSEVWIKSSPLGELYKITPYLLLKIQQ